MKFSTILFIFSVIFLLLGIVNDAMQTPSTYQIHCNDFKYYKNNETLYANNDTITSVISVEYSNGTLIYTVAEPIPLLTWFLLSSFLFTFLMAFLVWQKERGE